MAEFEKASPAATEIFASRSMGPAADMAKNVNYHAAKMWDQIHGIASPENKEATRLVDLSKQHLELAAMYAVKAVSRAAPQ